MDEVGRDAGCAAEVVVGEPVDVGALRAWLVAHAVPGVDAVEVGEDGSSVHRRIVPTGGPGADPGSDPGSGSGPLPGSGVLELALPAPGGRVVIRASGADRPREVVVAGRRWLGLDADPAPGVARLAGDPVLGPLVTARPHVRVPGSADPFATAVDVVLGQHVSLAAGRVFAGRLAAAHGAGGVDGRSGDRGRGLVRYPTADALAGLDAGELQRTVGVTGARARTVVALAGAVASGSLDLTPTDDAGRRSLTRAALRALPGVGPWTADLVALRCLRDPDAFLPGDLVLRRAMGGVTATGAARRAEAWAPHRSLAVVHLWTHHALDPR